MARIRSIKPEFFKHLKLFELEEETGLPLRLAFAGLWTVCDREGRFEWIPRQIKVDALPYDDVDFSRVLHALATRDFVRKYTVNNIDYGYVPGFSDHQVINGKERASNLPIPNENNEVERVGHASSTRQPRVPQGREGKGTSKDIRDYGLEMQEPETPDEETLAYQFYQDAADKHGWPKARKFDKTRKKKLKARLVEVNGIAGWREAVERATRSDFLTGKTSSSWKPGFDFFLNPDKLNKLLEGQYDNTGSNVKSIASEDEYHTPEEQLRLKWRDAADFKKENGRWPRNLDNVIELAECPEDIMEQFKKDAA